MQKKQHKIIHTYRRLALFLVMVSVFIGAAYLLKKATQANAETAVLTHGVATDNTIPSETGTKGTETNAFTILEIVPYEGFAEVGYQIAGCEPVDVNAMLTAKDPLITNLGVGSAATVTPVQQSKFELEATDNAAEWTNVLDTTITKTGYYQRVATGTGMFQQTVIETEILQDTTVTVIKDAIYSKQENGDFIWVTEENLDLSINLTNHNAINVGDKVYMSRTDTYYVSTLEYTYQNNNLFLKKVLDLSEDEIKDYHVIVKTIQANELNSHLEWIGRADLISISPKTHRNTLPTIWTKYNKVNKSSTINVDYLAFQENQDLSWDAVISIFKKVVVEEDFAAIIIDNNTYQNGSLLSPTKTNVVSKQFGYNTIGTEKSYNNDAVESSSNNMYKLCLMLRTMDPICFYNLYLNDNGGTEVPYITKTTVGGKTTGTFNKQTNTNAKLYWNKYTFMPTKADGTQSFWDDWYAGESWTAFKTNPTLHNGDATVDGKVYTFKGDMSMADAFLNTLEVPKTQYTKGLFDYLGDASLTSTTPAEAIKYILGYQKEAVNEKASITILDLEPCNYFVKGVRNFRLLMPTFMGTINIIKQTTATFNGKIEDLNRVYDMIYLGLNYNDTMFTLENNWPKYNDTGLNGKIYLHVGDKVMGSTASSMSNYPVDWLKNGAGKSETRLPGNDITNLKMGNLVEFLRAGYPIIVEPTLYELNKNRIDDTSYIYSFINDNKVNNLIDEVNVNQESDNLIGQYLAVIKPIITLITGPKPYVGNEADVMGNSNNLYINGSDINYKTLSFRFEISDNAIDATQKYYLDLYVDKNADGKFASNERIIRKRGYTVGTYTYTKNLGDSFIGAIPWKLAIVNQNNQVIRSEVTGISAIKKTAAEKETIRVLQITSDGDNNNGTTVNLTTHSVFRTYAQNLNDFNIVFQTIDTDQYEAWFNSVPFNANNKATTDKIVNRYDMLIFGFSDMYSNISNDKGAISNIEYFINVGKSVLFTHDVTSFNNKTYSDGGTGYNTNSKYQFGYNFNRMFRNYLSMDRFGARIGNGDVVTTIARDQATIPEGNGATYDAIHGYTPWALRRIGTKATNATTVNQVLVYPGFSYSDGNLETTRVAQLNSGQITMYPYKINETFTCASTHPQYFQLDLEDDNVVVWYCLSSDGNAANKNSAGVSYYDKSPNDASNNYYIYNKGNITYTGVGHSSISSTMEVRLFVNTIVAAYKRIGDPPTVEVVNTDSFAASDTEYYVYMNSDYLQTEFVADKYIDIEFVPKDPLSPQLSVFAETSDGDAFDIYDEDGNKLVPQADDFVTVNNDNKYYIKWPLAYIQDIGTKTIHFTIVNNKGINGASSAEVVRRNSFDLD